MFWIRNKRRARLAASIAAAAILIGLALTLASGCSSVAAPAAIALAHAAPEARELSAGALRGEYLSPASDAPVVLIIPGSGPTDRNGDNTLGMKPATYRLLAGRLAEHGVASVRVDKRGMFTSAAAGNPNDVSVDIYAEDYRSWIDAIRAETGRACVFLLGHSEGGLMASAAAQERSDVCGLVLVAAPGRPMGAILREQLRANPANAPILDQAMAAIDKLEAGERADTAAMHPALLGLFGPSVQPFLMSMMAADPAALAASAGAPVLIVQGSTDLQITGDDARALQEATGGKLVTLEGVNHVLKLAPADRAGNMATYADPNLPLAPGVAEAIAEFVRSHAR